MHSFSVIIIITIIIIIIINLKGVVLVLVVSLANWRAADASQFTNMTGSNRSLIQKYTVVAHFLRQSSSDIESAIALEIRQVTTIGAITPLIG